MNKEKNKKFGYLMRENSIIVFVATELKKLIVV